MKIQTRLIIINILFIMVIGALFGIFYIYNGITEQLETLIIRADSVKTDLYKTHVRLHQTLNGKGLKKSYDGFKKSYGELESEIQSILTSPLFSEAIASVPYTEDYVSTLKDSLQMNNKKIEDIDAQVAALLEQDPDLPGLLTISSSRTTRKEIEDAEEMIRFFSASFGESFTFTINQITGSIEKGAAQRQQKLLLYSGILSLILVAAVLAFSLAINIRLRNHMQRMHRRMGVIAEGDFSLRLEERGNNELTDLSKAINVFVGEFVEVIEEVKRLATRNAELKNEVSGATSESASAIEEMNENISDISSLVNNLVEHLERSGAAIEKITSHITDLSDRIEGQSSAITQSSSSIEEMTASIENVTKISEQRRDAAESLAEVTQTTASNMDETNALINENAEDVNQILEIIGIINNVAAQTNLLSMNAAIEAAHAGDAGHGFAVVAEEIRGLAESTNENSKKIRSTINTIAERIQKIYSASAENRKAFEQIESETSNSSNAMEEISSSMRELSQGSREIMDAMTNLTQTTQTIQESAEEMKQSTVQANEGLQEIQTIGERVNGEIGEINEEISDINDSMGRINKLNEENKSAVEKLYGTIDRFKIEEEPPQSST